MMTWHNEAHVKTSDRTGDGLMCVPPRNTWHESVGPTKNAKRQGKRVAGLKMGLVGL